MEEIRKFLSGIFSKAATYPVAALAAFIIGVLAVAWISGTISGNSERAAAKKEYDAKTKANEKALATALAEAEKATKRSQIAENEANAIIAENDKRAGTQTKKDAEIDSRIEETKEKGKIENEKINQNFNNDLRAIDNMRDDERAADICSRIERIAANNPTFAQYRCNANANADPDE